MILFFRTLKDIGFLKIKYRIFFEAKKLIYKFIPYKILEKIFFFKLPPPSLENKLFIGLKVFNNLKFKTNLNNNSTIQLKFLNKSKKFSFPIVWNDPAYSRLWNFNLHYFDWAREILEESIKDGEISKKLIQIEKFIDDWIDNNKLGKGDGWHSYTVSLRLRNWIWLFRCWPYLINEKRKESLWQQFIWLKNNLEYCYGGNHLLENLTSISICACQFKGKKSELILQKTLIDLQKQLEIQVLEDGGHEERSASYHILMLERLLEVACVLKITNRNVPNWLDENINLMLNWTNDIRIGKESFPRFNDSPEDGCSNINTVLKFGNSFIKNKSYNLEGLRLLLLNNGLKIKKESIKKIDFKKKEICNLPDTGWIIHRPNNYWEFISKCGKSCPKDLPAHAHSDLLSFDIFYKGEPVISEFGTSIYGNNSLRKIERSSVSHNTIQLGSFSSIKKKIDWIEPVEVWGNFRAARKAKIIKREFGVKKNNFFWTLGSHDGYKKINAFYERYIEIGLNTNGDLIFNCIDSINCEKSIFWRQWWHLGPYVNLEKFNKSFNCELNSEKINLKTKKSWYSKNFGERINRNSLFSIGRLKKGKNKLQSTIKIPKNILLK